MLFISQQDEIKLDESIQIMYFYTIWMPFHHKLVYVFSQLEEKYKIKFLAIDADHFTSQCTRFSITSVPVLLLFERGKEIGRVENSVRKQDFIDLIDDICSS